VTLVGLPLLALVAAAQLGVASVAGSRPVSQPAPLIETSTVAEPEDEINQVAPTPGAIVLAGIGLLACARRKG